MANNIKAFIYPAKDAESAKKFMATFLGVEPYVDSPYYVGYRVGDLEIGLDPNSETGPIGYIDVDDIKASVEAMTGAGAEIVQEPKDVANGLLIAKVKDANGNIVGFRQQT